MLQALSPSIIMALIVIFTLANFKISAKLYSSVSLYMKIFKMKSKNEYIGDDNFVKMLQHYHCDLPLEVVKMRFIGSICSPNLELRPSDVISSFWPKGQAPRLETKNEAELFFKFFMGLWDALFEQVAKNQVKLKALNAENKEELCLACRLRFDMLESGFLEGFWGGKEDLKLASYLAEIVDSLSDLAGVYASLCKKLESGDSMAAILPVVQHSDKMVEKAIAFLIENSVLPRIDSLKRVVN